MHHGIFMALAWLNTVWIKCLKYSIPFSTGRCTWNLESLEFKFKLNISHKTTHPISKQNISNINVNKKSQNCSCPLLKNLKFNSFLVYLIIIKLIFCFLWFTHQIGEVSMCLPEFTFYRILQFLLWFHPIMNCILL